MFASMALAITPEYAADTGPRRRSSTVAPVASTRCLGARLGCGDRLGGVDGFRRCRTATSIGSWLIWGAAGVGAMHFAMSYRLAYRDRGDAIRRHPVALLYVPALLLIAVGACVAGTLAGSATAADVLRSSVTIVFLLTMWHYIKQAYGVVRLAAGFAGFRLTSREALAIRYGLYPLWGLSVASYATGRSIADVDGFTVRADLVPALSSSARLIVVAVTGGVPGAQCSPVRQLANDGCRRPRWLLPLIAAVMWVGWIPNVYAAFILLPAFHALQYVACLSRAQHTLNGYDAPTSLRQQWELLQIFVAAACAGLFLTRYASPLLQRFVPIDVEPATWLLAMFVFLNLHHYLIDATVWRSNGELVGAVSGRRTPQPT